MRSDKSPTGAGMTTRQKLTIGVLVIVILLVLWQVVGMFGGSSTPAKSTTTANAKPMSNSTPTNEASSGAQPAQVPGGPEPSKLLTPAPAANSPEAVAAMAQQKELEAKYVDALNQLQMLRIQRDIAQTNQQIMAAKLATITAQRNIINIAAPPAPVAAPPVNYNKVMGGAAGTAGSGGAQGSSGAPETAKETPYRVISVSQIQYKWSAVIGYQGNLLHVQVGDVLPADSSTVVSINRSAVVISKDGVRRKLSLVPII